MRSWRVIVIRHSDVIHACVCGSAARSGGSSLEVVLKLCKYAGNAAKRPKSDFRPLSERMAVSWSNLLCLWSPGDQETS